MSLFDLLTIPHTTIPSLTTPTASSSSQPLQPTPSRQSTTSASSECTNSTARLSQIPRQAQALLSLAPEKESRVRSLIDEYRQREERGELKLNEDEKIWLSRECIVRFLTAVKWDVPSARARLDKCLAWRKDWGLYDLEKMSKDTEVESYCGKEFVLGYSMKQMPVLYFYPNRNNTEISERQLRHTVYMMERTIDLMPAGVSNLALIIDIAGKKQAPTSTSQAKAFVDILGSFYPERLGVAVILNLPWLVKKFLDMIFAFVDPVTKAKVTWDANFVRNGMLPKETALKDYGGTLSFTYDQKNYWPTLLKASMERRASYKRNWQALGGKLGLSEWDYKVIQAAPTSASPRGVPESLSIPSENQTQPPEQDHTASPSSTFKDSVTNGGYAQGVDIDDHDHEHHQDRSPREYDPTRSQSISSNASFTSEATTLHDQHGLHDPDAIDGQLKSRMDSLSLGFLNVNGLPNVVNAAEGQGLEGLPEEREVGNKQVVSI